jgi:hypothetical protein
MSWPAMARRAAALVAPLAAIAVAAPLARADRVYWSWSNGSGGGVSFANLDGSGGGEVAMPGASFGVTMSGVTIDAAAGRIYWANSGANKISWAKLDGTGAGDLPITGVTVSGPMGVAVDPVQRKIYWANNDADAISAANLDGSGARTVVTPAAPFSAPEGVAVDEPAGRIYYTNDGTLSFANLDGRGGGSIATGKGSPDAVALLAAPLGTSAPVISGGSSPGSVLSCSQGSWLDTPSSFVYRAARSFTYQWSLNGTDIAGATGTYYTAFVPGDYRCTVTGSNDGGSSSQTSAVHTVSVPAPPPNPAALRAAPVLSKLTQTHRRWREGTRLAGFARARIVPVGTAFSFTLNEPASVGFAFTRRLPGRSVNGRCVAQTKRNLHRQACTRAVAAGGLSFAGHSGLNKVFFQGRLSRTKRLPPGRYKVTATAANAAGRSSAPSALSFTIVKR